MPPSQSDKSLPPHNRSLSAEEERALRQFDEQEWRIEVTVLSVVPELGLAVTRSSDDHELRIRQSTPGVNWQELQPGQKLTLLIKGVLAPRVISVVESDTD